MDNILFAKLHPEVVIPSKREEDGAFDVYAYFEEKCMVIKPHETKMIPTGLCSAFSSDYVAVIKERGSTGTKGIGQRAGVIDSGYRGQWFIPVTNHNSETIVIMKKDCTMEEVAKALTRTTTFMLNHIVYPYEKAICQCIMVEVPKLGIKEVSIKELMEVESERGTGALGSSGK